MRYFVDTNIFVYGQTNIESEKHERAVGIISELGRNGNGATSLQVLNEYWSVMIRKYKANETHVAQALKFLASWNPIPLDMDSLLGAIELRRQYKFSTWDALIVSSAFEASCDVLLTEEMAHGARYHSVLVQNPFSEDFELVS